MVKSLYPVTRRELIRWSSLAAVGLAAAPLIDRTPPASAQGGVELVFWDSLFIEDEAIPIDQWFITQAIDRFQSEFPVFPSTASRNRLTSPPTTRSCKQPIWRAMVRTS